MVFRKLKLIIGIVFFLTCSFVYADISGQIRVRGEFSEKDFNSETDPFRSTFLRTRLNVKLGSAFVQIQDSRSYGSETNTLSDSKNLDLHQGYIQIDKFFTDPLSVKIGRMELAYGNQRLIGAVGWHNVGRSFDGTQIRYRANKNLNIDLFATKLVAQTDQSKGLEFGGIYAVYKPKKTYQLDLYLLGEWDRDQAVKDEVDLRRLTIGTFDKGKLSNFSYETEIAAQIGSRQGRSITAFMLTGLIGYAIDLDLKPKFSIGCDYLSGQDPEPGKETVFDTLFATNHKFYGFMDYFLNIPKHTKNLGLIDAIAKLQLQPTKDLTLKADLHQFLAAQPIKDDRNFGQEIDSTAVYVYEKSARFTIGGSLFLPGELKGEDPAF